MLTVRVILSRLNDGLDEERHTTGSRESEPVCKFGVRAGQPWRKVVEMKWTKTGLRLRIDRFPTPRSCMVAAPSCTRDARDARDAPGPECGHSSIVQLHPCPSTCFSRHSIPAPGRRYAFQAGREGNERRGCQL